MIRIGTRASKLARWQAEWVSSALAAQGFDSEIIFLKTLGDVRSGPIGTVGTQGVFTKEIQRALLDRQVDLAVHSLKDLPTEECPGLELAAIPLRESCADALVATSVDSLRDLAPRAKIGTGSARRRAQLLAYRDDLEVQDLRGNVDTRLNKLAAGELDAIILAEAGLRRLGLEEHISAIIPATILLPAVGQGALGLEIRGDDAATRSAIQTLNHEASQQAVLAERNLLRSLRGGCLAPVGAWARLQASQLRLDAVVLNEDGSQKVIASGSDLPQNCEQLGAHVAELLRAQGAEALLDSARNETP